MRLRVEWLPDLVSQVTVVACVPATIVVVAMLASCDRVEPFPGVDDPTHHPKCSVCRAEAERVRRALTAELVDHPDELAIEASARADKTRPAGPKGRFQLRVERGDMARSRLELGREWRKNSSAIPAKSPPQTRDGGGGSDAWLAPHAR
jgi:hypothetical protein